MGCVTKLWSFICKDLFHYYGQSLQTHCVFSFKAVFSFSLPVKGIRRVSRDVRLFCVAQFFSKSKSTPALITMAHNVPSAFYPVSTASDLQGLQRASPELFAKEDRYVEGLSDNQFPVNAGQVEWPFHGVKTYLPFFRGVAPPHVVSWILSVCT